MGSVMLDDSGGTGSEKAKMPRARLQKLFRYALSGLDCNSLYISKQIIPATKPVVVAMAGMIFPAMPRDTCFDASEIR